MIDLHIHTNHSDGTCSTEEVLRLAEQSGITLLSITDHNRVDSYEDLKNPAIRNLFSGKILPACEVAACYKGQMIDILGYGIDPEKLSPYLDKWAEKRTNYFARELKLIYETLKSRGVRLDLPMEEFSKEKHRNPRNFIYKMLQHPDNEKFFLESQNRTNWTGYFRRELTNPESPLFVDYSVFYISPQEAIEAIRAANGKPFLAHCFQYGDAFLEEFEQFTKTFKLDGIECWHFSFTKEQSAFLEAFCEKNGLLMSGGSDFHGATRPQNKLGVGTGSLYVKPERILPWAEKYLF